MENTKMENAVQELANIQSQCQELIDRIREIEKEIEQNEPKFERVKKGERYFMIGSVDGKVVVYNESDVRCEIDDNCFDNNNYFKTPERAQEVVDKINFLLKLERLHDTFCPDYVPNFDSSINYKYAIYYDYDDKIYEPTPYYLTEHRTLVYFPSEEIAQKVCNILNKERENNDES